MIPIDNYNFEEAKKDKSDNNLESNIKIALELKNKGYEDDDIIRKMLSLNNLNEKTN